MRNCKHYIISLHIVMSNPQHLNIFEVWKQKLLQYSKGKVGHQTKY